MTIFFELDTHPPLITELYPLTPFRLDQDSHVCWLPVIAANN